MLFAGTGHGFYYSLDDGAHWTELATGLPHAPVTWIVVQKQFHDVVVSTYGRGMYILDDITPLEQLTHAESDGDAAVRAAADISLVAARPRAISLRARGGAARCRRNSRSSDPDGKVDPRRCSRRARQGINRAIVGPALRAAAARRAADDAGGEPAHLGGAAFRGRDTRPVTHWGLDPAEVGPIVAPGKYTVKLTVDGQTFTQPIDILKGSEDTHDGRRSRRRPSRCSFASGTT